uniref:phospholipase A2 n=1 Tax=Varanus komodoensis TaxID=61221 RepID=A0A8D2JK17_VARKO
MFFKQTTTRSKPFGLLGFMAASTWLCTAFCLAGDTAGGGAGPGRALRFLWQSPRWPDPVLVSSVWDAGAGERLLGCSVTRAPDESGWSAERCPALRAELGAPLRDDSAPGVQRSLAVLAARIVECPVLSLRDAAAFAPTVRALEAAARAARERVRRGVTMPGTVWCGAGDSASDFSDLGAFQGPDSCCREHDQCSVQITALQRKHGIFNLRPYTISHCDCDTRFRTCLMDLNDTIADFIGTTYFSVLQIPCFYLEESDEACLEWAWWVRRERPVCTGPSLPQGLLVFAWPTWELLPGHLLLPFLGVISGAECLWLTRCHRAHTDPCHRLPPCPNQERRPPRTGSTGSGSCRGQNTRVSLGREAGLVSERLFQGGVGGGVTGWC